ncbi:MAG TPA: LysM peptidoglycan-binding domain-containing M23 family metallopeptidase, partial [Candidatus Binatia bacterium]|nr:LysM peptidoglycan-binding domain-containing M23 family metallopeptidase [Candidatus Binatia bacterium]
MSFIKSSFLIRYCVLLCLCLSAGCAPQTSAPTPKRFQGIFHTVKPGENLYRIGKAYDVSYEELARVNRVKDAGQIRVGQRIFIPGTTRQVPVDVVAPTDRDLPTPSQTIEPVHESFLWPVSGTINSGFGPRGASFHDGIDIAAPAGTPIRAIEYGEVLYSDQLRGYGKIVIIRHAGGLVSLYAHNEANLVRDGQ